MKTIFSVLLILVTSIFAVGQGLKPVTREFLAMAESANQGKSSLKEMYSLVEYDSKYFSTHNAYLLYGKHQIFAGDMVYEPTNGLTVAIQLKSQSDYIFFRNIHTGKIERVIDLKDILKGAKIKQIWGDANGKKETFTSKRASLANARNKILQNKKPSIAITEDGKYLFFGTATNTYQYDLTTDEWNEIVIDDTYITTLSPENEIVKGNGLIFMIMTPSGRDGLSSNHERYIVYDYISKKHVIKN